jgi:NADPH2 dehydrogenase
MASQTASEIGFVTESTLAHYERLSQSQAGLVIVEYTYVHSTGRSEVYQLGISDDAYLGGLTKLATKIRNFNYALVGIQLTHGGGKTSRELTCGVLMGPSSIPVPVRDQQLETPDAMTEMEIEMWKDAFIAAAGRAVLAGFDLIEIHSAHGYGLNQWLSPLTNQRTDHFGGSFDNRSRLLLEILGEIRLRFPDLLISVRIPGQDFLEGGLTLVETIKLAQQLESVGVDLIHVSSGIGGWKRPRDRSGEGYLVEEAATIQRSVKTPVIGVGGIHTGEFIDSSLQVGRFSLAAVGRAILNEPKSWYELVLATNLK